MSAREEIEAAASAARDLGMEYVFTASFDTAGKTMMGIPPSELGAIAAAMSPHPWLLGPIVVWERRICCPQFSICRQPHPAAPLSPKPIAAFPSLRAKRSSIPARLN